VRTEKGEVGYVPLASIVLLKDLPGAGLPKAAAPSHERISYDARPEPPAPPVNPPFVLPKGTHVHLKALKTVTSATAHTSDAMEFAVIEDALVDGVIVILRGAKATGVGDSVETKKRFGRGGSLAFHIAFVRRADNEEVLCIAFRKSPARRTPLLKPFYPSPPAKTPPFSETPNSRSWSMPTCS
jgi:hypothetical protein